MKEIKFLFIYLLILILSISCSDGINENFFPSSFKWTESIPEDQGLNSAQLNRAFQEGENRSHIYSFVVIRNGHLVAEKYYHSYNSESAFNIRSVSKSYLSAMAGIAIRENFIESIDKKMLDYFPEYNSPGLDSKKHDITIKHLLTMRGGIDHEQNNYSTLHNSANWIKSTIEFPLSYNPGERFSYNTFLTHLLSAIITKTANLSTLEFGKKFLFDSLGINCQEWAQDPQGIYFGGNNMHFTTRDMARLGYLYLNNGLINGRQIVPHEWVSASLTSSLQTPLGDWGELKKVAYGYLWWLGKMKGYKVFTAIGFGGQFVMCFPELNMIVAANSDPYIDSWDDADENEREVLDIIANYILQAVM